MKTQLKEYKKTLALSKTEVAGDPFTRPGREMVRKQAIYSLPNMRKSLLSDFKKVGFPVFLSGAESSVVVKLASEMTDVISVDFVQATATIRNAIKSGMSRKNQEFSPSMYTYMTREVKALCTDLEMSTPDMTYDGAVYMGTEELLTEGINRYLFKDSMSQFVSALIEQEALNKLAESDIEAPVVVVFVSGVPTPSQDAVARNCFNGKSLSVVADKDVNEEFVTKMLKAVKQSNKK